MSTILVTGGAGFIGSHFCEALLRAGNKVIALDSLDDFYEPAVKRRNMSTCLKNECFTLIEGDIRSRDAVNDALDAGVEIIVHLAARAGVRPSIEFPLLYEDVNVRGTLVLLEAARNRGIKSFVLASSSSVYGNGDQLPFSEDSPTGTPLSPYAATKRAGELLAHTYNHLFGINITCLRYFTVYGPRQRPDLAIHKFTRLIRAGEPVPLYGDGDFERDFTYIDDIVAGTLSAIERCAGFAVFNLGGGHPVRVRDLVAELELALQKKAAIRSAPRQPGDVERTWADISLARKELGYEPSVDLKTGIRRFVEWYDADT